MNRSRGNWFPTHSVTRLVVKPSRRIIQVVSILLLVGLPFFALYTHYKAARAIDDLQEDAWRSKVIRKIDGYVGKDKSRREVVESSQGTFWSMRVAGFSLSDPLAGAETFFSSRSFYEPMFWSMLAPIVLSVVLGRIFCGWICPMNTLLELVDRCRRLLRLFEIRERDVKFSLWNKYVILFGALGFAAFFSTPFLAMVYPPAVISRETHQFVFGTAMGLGLYFILGVCVFELFVSKRWWCRYICPGGALYSLLGRFRLIRIRRNEDKCVGCGDCVQACQFDLKPMMVEITGMECTNCASCITSCDSSALKFSFVLPIPKRKRPKEQPHEFPIVQIGNTQPTEIPQEKNNEKPTHSLPVLKTILFALCILGTVTTPAHAHHILGLPHYSYKENYPQAPTLEYPAETGSWKILMTSYPGRPIPGEAARIAFYIKNKHTQTIYPKPVTVRVLKTSTFGANEVVFPSQKYQPFDNEHKFTMTFPDDGEYIIELTMEVEGKIEVIPFLMVVGNPTATMSIVTTIGLGLLVFLVVVRAIKKKRDRRILTAARKKPEFESVIKTAAAKGSA